MSFRTVSILEQIERVSFGVAMSLCVVTVITGALALCVAYGVDLIAW